MRDRIPAGIRRDGVRGIGDERHLRGTHLLHQRDKAVDRIAFDVELGGEHLFERPHVVVADVAGVGTRMHRNAVGTEAFDVERRTHHVGPVAAARIAHYGNLIDVHTQLCHNFAIFASINSSSDRRAPDGTAPARFRIRRVPSRRGKVTNFRDPEMKLLLFFPAGASSTRPTNCDARSPRSPVTDSTSL